MRKRTAVLAVLSIAFLFLSRLAGDLDVAIPPGTPLEWRHELPFHRPDSYRGPVYKPALTRSRPEDGGKKEEEKPRGPTVVVRTKVEVKKQPALQRFGSFNPLGAARILTLDITAHLGWTRWTKQDSPPGELDYPPKVRSDLHWLVLATLLRPLMHPAKVSVAETVQYLITIGHPALDPIGSFERMAGPAKSLIQYLKANVPEVPRDPPSLKPLLDGVKDPERRMLIAWASRELVSDHLYAYNPLYARRTLSLGAEAIEVLLALSRSSHPLLSANAAGILAAYDTYDEGVRGELLRIVKGKDAVARNRAIEGLAGYGDPELGELLLKSLGSPDGYFRAYAIHVLGRMRSVKALEAIQGVLRSDPKDRGDLWLAAIAALARLPDPTGSSIKVLKSLERAVAQLPRSLDFEGTAYFPPDIPDRPGDRARLILQAITTALARLGDETAQEKLMVMLSRAPGGSGPPGDRGLPGLPGFARAPVDPVLANIEPMNQVLAIEALGSMGDRGRSYLQMIVKESIDPIVRGYALDHLCRQAQDRPFVLEVARSASCPSALRVQAMEALAAVEAMRAEALKAAKAMVDSYLSAPGGARGPIESQPRAAERVPSYECLAAVKLLGKHEPLPAAALFDLLRQAVARGDYERITRREAPPNPPGGAGPGQVEEVTLQAFPALYETVVVELGRTGDPQGLAALKGIVAQPQAPGRAEAALGLGHFKTQGSCDALIAALGDKEPWVRYSAYRALRQLSGENHFADWLFGKTRERGETVKKWKEWRAGAGAELPRDEELTAGRKNLIR